MPTAAPKPPFAELLRALSEARAYPDDTVSVEVVHTHISAVFLAGPSVYKLKKPVRLAFLDFSTLAARHHFCREEVRLNRRLAPDVYLGVVPIVRTADGIRVGGAGEVLDYAVHMARLPAARNLEQLLARGELEPALVAALAARIARFHVDAEAGQAIARDASAAAVETLCLDNLRQTTEHIGRTSSARMHARLTELTVTALSRQRQRIDERAARGVARDTHGDLHLEHVYSFPDRAAPNDLVIVDCIEFNPRFRHCDPVADMAFLSMDLRFHGRADLAARFDDAYFAARADPEGRPLLPLYTAYRAAVRAKVDGILAAEREVPEAEREAARARARAHWLLALGELERPGNRPALVLMAGLPGSAKSTLAAYLGDAADFVVVTSDLVRKELAGRDAAPAAFGAGIYTSEWDELTYGECRRRAAEILEDGGRVLVDASFHSERERIAFLALASRLCVRSRILLCQADRETTRARLAARASGPSDADWAVYQRAAERWQEPGAVALAALARIDTSGSRASARARALDELAQTGLYGD